MAYDYWESQRERGNYLTLDSVCKDLVLVKEERLSKRQPLEVRKTQYEAAMKLTSPLDIFHLYVKPIFPKDFKEIFLPISELKRMLGKYPEFIRDARRICEGKETDTGLVDRVYSVFKNKRSFWATMHGISEASHITPEILNMTVNI